MITKHELRTALATLEYVNMEIETADLVMDAELETDGALASISVTAEPGVIAQMIRLYATSLTKRLDIFAGSDEVEEMVSFLDSVS